jgi:hypothetical protein
MEYPLTKEQKDTLFEIQECKCAICGVESESVDNDLKQLSTDHDHETNMVRGLLCSHCNLGLGNFKDNISLLRRAITYLTVHKQRDLLDKWNETRGAHDFPMSDLPSTER